jgi:hypothetical protein
MQFRWLGAGSNSHNDDRTQRPSLAFLIAQLAYLGARESIFCRRKEEKQAAKKSRP